MSTTISHQVRARTRPAGAASFAEDLANEIRARVEERSKIQFPSGVFRDDPVRFFRQIVGVEPWSKQIEIIEAIRDHPRVAVRSGHKVSKSHTVSGIALWFYCSFEDARVIMTSVTSRQVDQILWRELRMMVARGGRCVDCKLTDPDGHRIPRPCPHSALIDPSNEIHELARSGLKSPDFREIVGFTAKEAEAVAGISGKNLLYLCDEASGIPEEIFEAIEGNRAAGARIVLTSNPTRNEGEHFEAFHSKAELYRTITVSSEDTPNVVEGRVVIPGLATREWVREKEREYGRESAWFKVRVLGVHVEKEEGRVISLHEICQAQQLWEDTEACGRLFIGADVAGAGGQGDESVFAVRRGLKILELAAYRGLDEDGHLTILLQLIEKHRKKDVFELPVVVLDREGKDGSRVYGRLLLQVEQYPSSFELAGVRSSERAIRQPQIYDRVRDELYSCLHDWFRAGGTIPEDSKLEKELHAPEWFTHINGRLKVTRKEDLRKKLGRSPDRADAIALAVWETEGTRPEEPPVGSSENSYNNEPISPYDGAISPYG